MSLKLSPVSRQARCNDRGWPGTAAEAGPGRADSTKPTAMLSRRKRRRDIPSIPLASFFFEDRSGENGKRRQPAQRSRFRAGSPRQINLEAPRAPRGGEGGLAARRRRRGGPAEPAAAASRVETRTAGTAPRDR